MKNAPELLVSATDAEALVAVLADMRHSADAAAADALHDVLDEARLVPHERLPADQVAMGSRVDYEDLATGTRRSLVLAHPADADPAQGRVSVLSPIGRALLGRSPGTVVATGGPGGRSLSVRILAVEKPS